MHWWNEPTDYNIKECADRVLEHVKSKMRRDGRFRAGTMAGTMQDLFLGMAEKGIVLKKRDLIHLWKTHCLAEYEVFHLKRKRKEMLRQQTNLAVHIKGLTREIEKRTASPSND